MATFSVVAFPAAAANEPVLEWTDPGASSRLRSEQASPILATYDRDLSARFSSMTVSDGAGAPVPGVVALAGPVSETGGQRSIAFHTTLPLTEPGSPYSVHVEAYARAPDPFVPGDHTHTDFSFVVDDTAPLAPQIDEPAEGSVQNAEHVVARGVAEGGARLLILEGDATVAQTIVAPAGTFAVELPYGPEDGVTHAIRAVAIDEAGNESAPSDTRTFIHDSVLTAPFIMVPAEGQSFPATSISISGSGKPGTTLIVREGATTIGSTIVDAEGKWSMPGSFAAGAHTIGASSYNPYGLEGVSPARTFSIDLVAPEAPVILTPAGPTVRTSTVTVSGTAEALATVRIRDAGLIRAEVPVSASGEWAVALPFTQGPHAITAVAIDAAGNIGPPASRSFTVDSVPPPAPVITAPAEGAVFASGTVTITGGTEPGVTVAVLEAGAVLATTTADGAGEWAVTIGFASGTHSVVAVATDLAGNQSPPSGERTFVVDTVAPAAPVILLPTEGATLESATVTVSGTAEALTTVTLLEGATVLATAPVNEQGHWARAVTFAPGSHTIVARATDAAGNTGPSSAPRTFTIAASAVPGAPLIVNPPEGSVQPAVVRFTGTAAARSRVRVFEAATVIATTTAAADGTWQVAVGMSHGPHTVRATAASSGGTSPRSAARSFSVDAIRPEVTIDVDPLALVFLPGQPVTLRGTASDDLAVHRVELEYYNRLTNAQVTTGTADVCTGCPGTPIVWEAHPTLPAGVFRVLAYAVDPAGNRSAPASWTFARL